jgi:predicted nicotinamide N-methyase
MASCIEVAQSVVPSKEAEEETTLGEAELATASVCEEETSSEQPASVCETTTDEGTDDDYFADVGFMFEASQPTKLERFQWDIGVSGHEMETTATGTGTTSSNSRSITVALHVADDTPGAVQSGHYLWPAAYMLADYLVNHYHSQNTNRVVLSVVELGAGCALASLTALQLWHDTLQCVVVTDHDPGTLVRARDNLETTVQHIIEPDHGTRNRTGTGTDSDDDADDEHLNSAINSIASIPVLFESLEWGDQGAVSTILQNQMQEHMMTSYSTATAISVDVVLGSDLIYCADVVEPLLQTARQLMGSTGCFLLSQSFVYESATETEIDRVCKTLGLTRTIHVDEDHGARRIQEFIATPSTAEALSD